MMVSAASRARRGDAGGGQRRPQGEAAEKSENGHGEIAGAGPAGGENGLARSTT
jgi:hypothetical protein